MKKLKIILMFPLLLLLCSFTRSGTYGTVGITICAYTQATNASDGNAISGGYPFVEIENNRSWSLDLGYYQLPPFYKCTLSVWENWNDGIQNVTAPRSLTSGLYFNKEAYLFNHTNMQPTDCLKYYVEVDHGLFLDRMYGGDFVNGTHYLKTIATQFSNITFNSTRFVREFFYKATNLDILVQYGTPIQLKHSINLLLNHTQDNTVFSSSNFFRYDNFGNSYAYQ